jgi:hypothetical protein
MSRGGSREYEYSKKYFFCPDDIKTDDHKELVDTHLDRAGYLFSNILSKRKESGAGETGKCARLASGNKKSSALSGNDRNVEGR